MSRTADFERVYRGGRPYSHSLLRMHMATSPTARTRVGFVAGRRVGSAVTRNRAKRLMREAARGLLPEVMPGKDIVFVAHRAMARAGKSEAADAMQELLRRAGLMGEHR